MIGTGHDSEFGEIFKMMQGEEVSTAGCSSSHITIIFIIIINIFFVIIAIVTSALYFCERSKSNTKNCIDIFCELFN